MRDDSDKPTKGFDQLIKGALKTPPISNEEIERRSKERRERAEARPRSQK